MDNITKPTWYYNNGKASVGPLDYAEQQDLSIEAHAVVKYITRAGRKPGNTALKDLKQAKFYLDRMIERLVRVEAIPISAYYDPLLKMGLTNRRIGPTDRRKCQDFHNQYTRRTTRMMEREAGETGRRKTDVVRYSRLPHCEKEGC